MDDIDPLGHRRQTLPWRQAAIGSGILRHLTRFAPRIAGTLPLGISVASSDIDILCCASDPNEVGEVIWQLKDSFNSLSIRRWISAKRPLIAAFTFADWPIEVFASPVPVDQQAAWLHFVAERRLLTIGGEALRDRVLALRNSGLKTEPAFAKALGLQGDPYDELCTLANAPRQELHALVTAARYSKPQDPKLT